MRKPVLYLVSLFPCWSETFIVRELHALKDKGVPLSIASLKHHHEPLVHPFAESLRDRVIYPSGIALLLWHALVATSRKPFRNLAWLWRVTKSLWRHPDHLLKSYGTIVLALDLAERLRAEPPSRVHAHWATYPSTAAMILADNLNIPFSFTCHAHDIFLQDHLLKEKIARAEPAVTISEFNVDFLNKRLKGLPKPLEIVHCGVDLDDFSYYQGERLAGNIVAVGRLDEIKGFAYLIQACGALRKKGVAFTLTIIGEGEERPHLERLIQDLDLKDQVTLAGVMAQDQVRDHIKNAALFALPSIPDKNGNMDGIPVALMEAMALGTPVISTRVSGIPELVEHQVTGWMCEPKDADGLAEGLETLLTDPKQAMHLASTAHQRIEENFDCRKEAQKLLNLFEGRKVATAKGLTTINPTSTTGRRKVLIVTDEMEVGGSQRQIANLLTAIDQTRIEPVLLYFREHSFLVDQIKAKGVRVHYLPKSGKIDWGFFWALVRFLRQERFDVIHAYSITAELWVALARRLAGTRSKLISSIRGQYDEYSPLQWRIKQWVTRQSAEVISNSKMAAQFAYRQMAMPDDDCTIIYNGVQMPDPSLPLPADLATKRSGDDWLLAFVGRLSAEKNVPCLLRAAKRLQETGQERITIWLIGDGPERPKLEAMAADFGLENLHFLGARNDVDAILRHADGSVLCSLWEGLSNALLEAMAAGKPVIASDVGGSPEIVHNERNGLLFPSNDDQALADAIRRLAADPELSQRLGRQGKADIAERFSVHAMVDHHQISYGVSRASRTAA
ncbi:MAG: glycosyltransferase [Alphaproteobacteria bacterium GM202ARS2]|nr:glycosyltransferase [Alphaproteobacteria bacterium GM202ARS2]